MKTKIRALTVVIAAFLLVLMMFGAIYQKPVIEQAVLAQKEPEATPTPQFDQAAAVAKLREQIKGREQEPAEMVFKNIQNFKGVAAGRIPAIMEMGYSRSLGVNCTHCHTPENWADETKPTKQIAREMQVMAGKINGEMLMNIKGLEGRTAVVNCTTCHRGEIKPPTNMSRK